MAPFSQIAILPFIHYLHFNPIYILLVFFDEFDSSFEVKLGWLKYFLAPMQDEVFREGDS
jgi:hypothetical protein